MDLSIFFKNTRSTPPKHQKTQIKEDPSFMPLKILKDDKIYQIQGNLQKNQLHLKLDNQLYIIELSFWSTFEPILNDNSQNGFIIKLSAQNQYIFYVKNLQQLNFWKKKFSTVIILKGFYNDYKPLKKIGQGKSASVFLAKHRATSQNVAIKAFSKNSMREDPTSQKALQNEIQILRSINSPNLIKLDSFYETDKSYYIITQYIQGLTLRNLIEFSNIEYDRIIDILKKILEAINYLSKKAIVHRDLKPQNILIQNVSGKIVIVDFGLALQLGYQKQHLYMHCGTPGFIAPEILDEQNYQVNYKSDIFSLGIIFHLMLLKKFPYKNASIQNIVIQNREANFNIQSPQYQCISHQARVLLEKMLAKNPKQRLSSQQFLQYFQRKQNKLNQNRISPIFESNQNQKDKVINWSVKKTDTRIVSPKAPIKIHLQKVF